MLPTMLRSRPFSRMALHATKSLFFWLLATTVIVHVQGAPWTVLWSDQTYGPDGPWHAVSVELGSNKQPVDLYPGDRWASTILIDTVCLDNSTITCYAERAGLFNISASTSAVTLNKPTNTSQMTWLSDQSSAGVNKWGGTGHVKEGILADTLKLANGPTVPNVSIASIYDAYETYPNGKSYPVSVGILSLGGTKSTHTVDGNTFNMLSAWEYFNNTSSDRIPSYSWGLHIGSVEPELPGSLMLGGYDQNRVVGEVSSQQVATTNHLGNLNIYLKDIGIGVAIGDSPFYFNNKSDLLLWGGSNTGRGKTVEIDPTLPYLYLPRETCDAMAAELPVTFNEGLGLYFWDTGNSSYQKITSSPAYMSFTFEKDAVNTQSITIKVPFQLLKLTLQEPLVEHNTTYFPCYPSDSFVLGRAFLQAAFIGTNWQDGTGGGYWFLAQAPGPSIGSSVQQSIGINDTSIKASTNSWEESWSEFWVPLSSESSSLGLSSESSSSGLSPGAKAGIGVGCAIGGLVLVGIFAWLIIFHRNQKANSHPETQDQYSIAPTSAAGTKSLQVTELYHHPSELQSDKDIHEAPGFSAMRHELR